MDSIIEITAAVFGLLGTLVLATNGRWAGWGFVAFLVSNAGWLAFSFQHAHWFLFCQHLGFALSSCFGIYVWLIKSGTEAISTTNSTVVKSNSDARPEVPFIGCCHYIPDDHPVQVGGKS